MFINSFDPLTLDQLGRAGLAQSLRPKEKTEPSLQILMTQPGHPLKPLAMSAVLWQHFP